MNSHISKLKEELPIIIFAFVNVVIHLMVIHNLEYHRDELLYFSLGEHVDFGFATVPPMIGWIAWLMQNIFGYSLFAVRLFPALLSGFLVIMTSSITKELGGPSYARILAALGITISSFALRTFSLFMPVFLDVIFWTAIIWIVIRYINTSSGRYLIFLGIVAGLSLLNKYLIGILFVSLAVVIPFTRHKKIFRDRYFLSGMFCAAIIFLPNLIWQISHGLPVISHLSTLNRTQLVHVDPVGFLADQLIMPSFASILTIAGIIYLFRKREAMKFRFLGVVMILVVVFLFALHGKGYYTIGIFPFLIASGAVSYEKWIKKRWVRTAFPLFLILITLPMLPIGLPVYKSAKLVSYFRNLEVKYGIIIGRRFEDGSIHSLPQDYADMLGWEELTAIARDAYQQIPDKKASFIYCENYGQAGAITIIGKKYGLPAAVSFQESFRYWIPVEFNPDITSFIYINDEMGEDVRNLFGKITLVGRISNHDAREYGTGVFLCEDPKMSFNEFWRKRLTILQNSDSLQ